MSDDLNHLAAADGSPVNGHPGSEDSIKDRVLALRGKKSYSLIAEELGISRSRVAGICFRASNNGAHTVGRPRGGSAEYAAETKPSHVHVIGYRKRETRERVALAIGRADNQAVPEGYADGFNDPDISDWSLYLADEVLRSIGRVWLDGKG